MCAQRDIDTLYTRADQRLSIRCRNVYVKRAYVCLCLGFGTTLLVVELGL